MKKILCSVMIAAALAAGVTAFAQPQGPGPQCPQGPCPQGQVCPQGPQGPMGPQGQCPQCPCPAPCDSAACAPGQGCPAAGPVCQALSTIDLTDAQKEQVKALGQPGLSPQQLQDAQQAARADYLKQLATVLTPEQYNQFLTNYFVNGGNQGPRQGGKMAGHKGYGDKGPKFDKKDCKKADCDKRKACEKKKGADKKKDGDKKKKK